MHRPSDPPFDGFRLLEGPQSPRRRAEAIYRAKDADAAKAALDTFDASHWGQKYPAIAQSWRRNWERVIPFFAFPEAVRRINLHHQRHRVAQRKATPRCAHEGAFFQPMTPQQSFCFSSCAIPRESGKCHRASGSRQKPNSPSCSTKGSFKRDGSTRPAHKIPDSPAATKAVANQLAR